MLSHAFRPFLNSLCEGNLLRRIATIVWNFQERRLRAGYRVILFFLLWGMGPALLHLVLDRLLQGLIGRGGEWALSIYLNLVRLAAVLVGAWVAARSG